MRLITMSNGYSNNVIDNVTEESFYIENYGHLNFSKQELNNKIVVSYDHYAKYFGKMFKKLNITVAYKKIKCQGIRKTNQMISENQEYLKFNVVI